MQKKKERGNNSKTNRKQHELGVATAAIAKTMVALFVRAQQTMLE
jgi:hypothetical protein